MFRLTWRWVEKPNNLQAWAGEVMLTFRGLVSMPEFSTMQILVVVSDHAVICGNAKVAPKCTILSLLAVMLVFSAIQVLGIM